MTARGRPAVRRALGVAALLAVLGAAGYGLAREWGDVLPDLRRLGPAPLVGAWAATSAGLACAVAAWRAVLAGLGAPVPARPGARMYLVGQLGKYLPGSVWPVVAQMEMGRRLGVARSQAAASYLVVTVVSLVTGGLVALLAAAGLLRGGPAVVPVLVAVPVGVVLLHPAVLNRLLAAGLRLLRRPGPAPAVPARAVLGAAGWFVAVWVCYGLQAVVLAGALHRLGAAGGVAVVGAYALATVAGLLAVFAPAGAGVREVVLVAVLASVLPVAAAVALALVSRVVVTVADLTAAGAAALLAGRVSPPAGEPAPPGRPHGPAPTAVPREPGR